MDIREPTTDFVTVVEDSRRWKRVRLRPDDIVISTPPKSGTTWMQGIVSSLLWPDGDAPGDLGGRSPWVDMRLRPIDELAELLEAQPHRRFIKTHSPADAIPFGASVRHIVVHRHAPDALVSWGNHRATMRPEIMGALNAASAEADGLPPLPLRFDGDYDALFDEWSRYCSPALHLASWWPLRDRADVLMLHYADLSADLDGEMRRVAAFLDLDIAPDAWPAVVERCRIDSMREAARASGAAELGFEGGADSFFNKGTNGEGRRQLDDELLDRVAEHCAAHLDAEALDWLAHGAGTPV
jgi:aryl sulfotransferase